MSFPPHVNYKDSGVEWLGEVPSHWRVEPLKREVRLVNERANDRRHPIGLENIESWSGRLVASDSDFEGEGTAFRSGDILYGKLRPYLAKVYAPTFEGEAVGDFHVLRPAPTTLARFLTYSLLTRELVSILDGSTFGAKMPRVGWHFMSSLRLGFPSLGEQKAIVDFLDRETSKIDALVEAQRRLVTLLKEKRQAVISHAVTRGLDPSAPLKPSGIPWLGDVPAHWEVRKFRDMLRETPCYGVLVPDFDPAGVPMLRINDMTTGRPVDRGALLTISPGLSDQYDRTILEPGDLAITVVGTIGETVIADEELSGVNLSRAVARLRMAHRCSAEFATWLFKSTAFRVFVDLTCVGTAQRVLNMDDLSAIRFAIPPSKEQAQIVSALDIEVNRLEALVTEAEQASSLLQERRVVLISAAITGKIDVRRLAAQTEEAQAA